MPAPVTILINAAAGLQPQADHAQQVRELLAARGRTADVRQARSGDELVALAKQAVAGGAPVVVAGGGDGTVNAVASLLLGTSQVLGVLPLGTLNHFAKDLRVPLELEQALDAVFEGQVQDVDVGEVNGRVFLNNSSLGLYPELVATRLQHQRRGLKKWPAFALAALAVFRRFPTLLVRLDTPGSTLIQRTPFVFFGNNEYALDGLEVGRRKCLNAGLLSLLTTGETSRWGLLRLALGVLLPTVHEQQALQAVCVKEAWVETRHVELRVSTDGEITRMTTPLHYRVRAGALKALVPGPLPERPGPSPGPSP